MGSLQVTGRGANSDYNFLAPSEKEFLTFLSNQKLSSNIKQK